MMGLSKDETRPRSPRFTRMPPVKAIELEPKCPPRYPKCEKPSEPCIPIPDPAPAECCEPEPVAAAPAPPSCPPPRPPANPPCRNEPNPEPNPEPSTKAPDRPPWPSPSAPGGGAAESLNGSVVPAPFEPKLL